MKPTYKVFKRTKSLHDFIHERFIMRDEGKIWMRFPDFA
jgi:hypothetical protein